MSLLNLNSFYLIQVIALAVIVHSYFWLLLIETSMLSSVETFFFNYKVLSSLYLVHQDWLIFFHTVKFFSILFTDWEGPPPPKGCQVFIGLIAREVFEDELYHLFSTIGPIYELRLMMGFSGSNRGFAFVQYTNQLDVTDVSVAIRKLNKYEIRPNYRMGVIKSLTTVASSLVASLKINL